MPDRDESVAKIQRYDLKCGLEWGSWAEMNERDDGEYVLHADHLAALSAARREELERLAAVVEVELSKIAPRKGEDIDVYQARHRGARAIVGAVLAHCRSLPPRSEADRG